MEGGRWKEGTGLFTTASSAYMHPELCCLQFTYFLHTTAASHLMSRKDWIAEVSLLVTIIMSSYNTKTPRPPSATAIAMIATTGDPRSNGSASLSIAGPIYGSSTLRCTRASCAGVVTAGPSTVS